MGTSKSFEICIVLGIYFFNRVKFRHIKYDAFDNEILSWVVVSQLLIGLRSKKCVNN